MGGRWAEPKRPRNLPNAATFKPSVSPSGSGTPLFGPPSWPGRPPHRVTSPARRRDRRRRSPPRRLLFGSTTLDWLVEVKMPDAWDDQPIEVVEEAFAAQQNKPRVEWWDGLAGAELMQAFHDRVANLGIDSTLTDWALNPSAKISGVWIQTPPGGSWPWPTVEPTAP